MKLRTSTLLTTMISLGALPIAVSVAAPTTGSKFVTFDAPGAIRNGDSYDGTFPDSINNGGTVTGIYIAADVLYHGFVRGPGGEFVTLDAPGIGTSVGTRFRAIPGSVNLKSRSVSMNNHGAITGNYIDSNNVSHGFLRSPEGRLMTVDAPGASSAAGTFDGTFPTGINDGGTVAGNYIDSKDLVHGFLRSPAGGFTAFDAPGSGSVAAFGYGTFPESINAAGAVAGHYTDAHQASHGFVRRSSGKFTTFDAPGVSSVAASGYGTFPASINAAGVITGHFSDANGVYHGFVRRHRGEFTTFDAPGADIGTLPKSINESGAITGHFGDANGVYHGFVRSPGGTFTTFDAPGAGTAEGSGFGTFPDSINDAGAITGHYVDAQGLNHGFLRLP